MAHRIERIRYDDQDRIRRVPCGLFHDRTNDPRVLRLEIVAAHPGLPREPGGDHHDVRSGRVGVVVGSDDTRVVADDRRRLGQVETLALRQTFDDIDEDDIGQASLGDALGGGCADVAGADHRDLVAGHGCAAPLADWNVAVAGGNAILGSTHGDDRGPIGDWALLATASVGDTLPNPPNAFGREEPYTAK